LTNSKNANKINKQEIKALERSLALKEIIYEWL